MNLDQYDRLLAELGYPGACPADASSRRFPDGTAYRVEIPAARGRR